MPTPFFKILTSPTHTHTHTLQHSNTPILFLFSCFFDLACGCTTSDVLFYLMTLWIPWYLCTTRAFQCALCNKTSVYWGLTHDMVLVPWFDITHRQTRNTTHTGGNRLTHTYKYTPTIMCSQQLSVLHFMNNSLISKFYFTEFHNVFASWNCQLVEVTYLLIIFNETRFFPWNMV